MLALTDERMAGSHSTPDDVQAAVAAFEDSLQHAPTPTARMDARRFVPRARRTSLVHRPGESIEPARAICSTCLARRACRAYVLDGPWWVEGVWAGLSTRQRRKMTQAERDAA